MVDNHKGLAVAMPRGGWGGGGGGSGYGTDGVENGPVPVANTEYE